MPQIRPITDLRNTNEISDICHARKEPIFITKNGYGDLVIMGIETYEDMLEELEIDTAIAEAEAEDTADSQLLDARETLCALRRRPKHVRHCCKDMEFFSKLNCQTHQNVFDCPDCLISYNQKNKEYGIIVHDGGSSHIRINYCPWCGKKLQSN